MGLETEGGTVISEWDGLGTDMGRFKQSYRKQNLCACRKDNDLQD